MFNGKKNPIIAMLRRFFGAFGTGLRSGYLRIVGEKCDIIFFSSN